VDAVGFSFVVLTPFPNIFRNTARGRIPADSSLLNSASCGGHVRRQELMRLRRSVEHAVGPMSSGCRGCWWAEIGKAERIHHPVHGRATRARSPRKMRTGTS